jgi:hypothetical protein
MPTFLFRCHQWNPRNKRSLHQQKITTCHAAKYHTRRPGVLSSSCIVVEPPADLHGRERVGAGVLALVLGQLAPVPGADAHIVRLLHPHAHHLPHQRPQPRAAQLGPPQRARGVAAQVHRARHLQPVPVPQPGRVVADPDPDEGEPAVGEEVGQGVGDVVGASDLEDEAAAADADLQHGDGARLAGGPPLHVEAGDEGVAAAAVDAVGLVHPRLHHVAGLGERWVVGCSSPRSRLPCPSADLSLARSLPWLPALGLWTGDVLRRRSDGLVRHVGGRGTPRHHGDDVMLALARMGGSDSVWSGCRRPG